jgi:argininosuccinate lyase
MLKFDRRRMRAAVSASLMSTDLADYLVRRRVPFREAHRAVGSLVRQAELAGVELDELPDAAYRAAHPHFGAETRRELDPAVSVAHREIPGGTGPLAVQAQLLSAEASLHRHHAKHRKSSRNSFV